MTEAEILRSLVQRIEAVREEKKLLAGSERDLFAEAKGKQVDGKALRRVLQRRAMDDADREAFDDLVDQYESALGGKAAALALIRAGESVRSAARKTGIGEGTARRAKNLISGAPKHDPVTGEITERTAAHKPGAVPEGRLAGEEPAVPDPIPEPPAGAAPYATDCDPVAASTLPAVPAGDEDSGWEKADSAGNYQVALAVLADRAREARTVAALADDPGPPPDFLRAGSVARAAITGRR